MCRQSAAKILVMSFWESIFTSLIYFTAQHEMLKTALVRVKELHALLQIIPSVHNDESAPSLRVGSGCIEFKDVSFQYKKGKNTLHKVNFSIIGGETVAIVGKSGGGKSTILHLLERLIEPTAGNIEIDAQDIHHVTISSLRKAIGFASQTPAMMNCSVRKNV